MKASSLYSLLKFVYLASQLRHSLVVLFGAPLLRKILDPPMRCLSRILQTLALSPASMTKSRLNLKIIKSYWNNCYPISLFTESGYIVRSSYFGWRAGPHKPSKSSQRYRPAASRLRRNRKRIIRGKCAIAAERSAIVADQCAVKQPCLHECPKNFKANLKQNSKFYYIS